MALKIKADVLQALDDWNSGKAVRSIELGHVHRMKQYSDSMPTIDLSKRLYNDQERAHAYCFYLIGKAVAEGVPSSHEEFLAWELSGFYRAQFPDLTPEEAVAAESLAWKALLIGWQRALAGHDASRYIEVSKAEVAAT
jgi:hypothetical protein